MCVCPLGFSGPSCATLIRTRSRRKSSAVPATSGSRSATDPSESTGPSRNALNACRKLTLPSAPNRSVPVWMDDTGRAQFGRKSGRTTHRFHGHMSQVEFLARELSSHINFLPYKNLERFTTSYTLIHNSLGQTKFISRLLVVYQLGLIVIAYRLPF